MKSSAIYLDFKGFFYDVGLKQLISSFTYTPESNVLSFTNSEKKVVPVTLKYKKTEVKGSRFSDLVEYRYSLLLQAEHERYSIKSYKGSDCFWMQDSITNLFYVSTPLTNGSCMQRLDFFIPGLADHIFELGVLPDSDQDGYFPVTIRKAPYLSFYVTNTSLSDPGSSSICSSRNAGVICLLLAFPLFLIGAHVFHDIALSVVLSNVSLGAGFVLSLVGIGLLANSCRSKKVELEQSFSPSRS